MPRVRRKLIAQRANELLEQFDVQAPPVDVRHIALQLGADLRTRRLSKDLSGLMQRREGRVVIGINENQSLQRQRFTLAHELGHWLLGHGDTVVDTTRRRDHVSSQATNAEEIEANAFAAELLMPETLLRQMVERQLGPLDDEIIKDLADRFSVSSEALTFRLANIGLASW